MQKTYPWRVWKSDQNFRQLNGRHSLPGNKKNKTSRKQSQKNVLLYRLYQSTYKRKVSFRHLRQTRWNGYHPETPQPQRRMIMLLLRFLSQFYINQSLPILLQDHFSQLILAKHFNLKASSSTSIFLSWFFLALVSLRDSIRNRYKYFVSNIYSKASWNSSIL